jgi:hypothetical protein
MSAHQNPVIHPDENVLAAFAERALSGTEREAVLSHLSGCARCREVVFLAQEAAAPAEAAAAVAVRPVQRRWRRWQTATAGAWVLALIVGAVLLWHRGEKSPPTNEQAIVHPSVPPAIARGESSQQEEVSPPPPAPVAPTRQALNGPITAEKKAPERRKDVVASRDRGLAPAEPQAEMKAQSYIAPPAGAPEQQAAIPRNELRSLSITGKQEIPKQTNQTVLQEAPATTPGPPPPPVIVWAPNKLANTATESAVVSTQGQVSTVTVSSEPLLSVPPVSVSPGLPQYSVRKGKLVRLEAGGYKTVALPAGTRAGSVAGYTNLVLLLTTKRTVYRSTDSGEHWSLIPTQWNGKPEDLRLRMEGARPSPQKAVARRRYDAIESNQAKAVGGTAGTTGAGASNAALQPPSLDSKANSPDAAGAVFELTNSAGKRWVSRDGGQTWQPE